jgi:hypothetical protein
VRGSDVEREQPLRRPARLRLELERQPLAALGERLGQRQPARHVQQEHELVHVAQEPKGLEHLRCEHRLVAPGAPGEELERHALAGTQAVVARAAGETALDAPRVYRAAVCAG